MHTILRATLGLTFALVSIPALAATVGTVPEPGALSLLGIGAVAGLAVWAKNRNKKK